MKRFTVPCDFGEIKAHPFHIYIGEPSRLRHPLYYQARWLHYCRGGNIPQEVINPFSKLYSIALKNKVNFAELCAYALGNAQIEDAMETDGNVISIKDIQVLKKELKQSKKYDAGSAGILSDTRTLKNCRLLGCSLPDEAVREFCAALAICVVSTVKAELYTHQMAEGILEILLFKEAISRASLKKQKASLRKMLDPDVVDNALYNLMVLADTHGYLLSARQLGMLDQLFFCDDADIKRIINLVARALKTWSSQKATPTAMLGNDWLSAEEIIALKMAIKAFCNE